MLEKGRPVTTRIPSALPQSAPTHEPSPEVVGENPPGAKEGPRGIQRIKRLRPRNPCRPRRPLPRAHLPRQPVAMGDQRRGLPWKAREIRPVTTMIPRNFPRNATAPGARAQRRAPHWGASSEMLGEILLARARTCAAFSEPAMPPQTSGSPKSPRAPNRPQRLGFSRRDA